jgi:hypothetical protein
MRTERKFYLGAKGKKTWIEIFSALGDFRRARELLYILSEAGISK